jgi:hypothetical protein
MRVRFVNKQTNFVREKVRLYEFTVTVCTCALVYLLCSRHRVHRVATAAFWRTFHHEGKISSGWLGWGVHVHPLSLHLPSSVKLQCTLQLSGQIHWHCFISSKNMYSVVQGVICCLVEPTGTRPLTCRSAPVCPPPPHVPATPAG